ncbi:thioesterase II family protein [Saccharopolyspora sp. CA-218241]|uniref:thioesterase II family protein n=1 Tax=Saccharopolyspora sp. CA-218241 TaxID=3240027 RepID=UPI003D9984B3
MPDLIPLYCFPHAGATTTVFRPWADQAAARGFDIRAVDRPGRGARRAEPAATGLDALIASSARWVADDLTGAAKPARWAVFGHSFGAVVALAVAARLAATGARPDRAVLSAGLPPTHHSRTDRAAGLDDAALRDRIAADGATPGELLDGGPVTAMILARFRDDYRLRSAFPDLAGLVTDLPLTIVAADRDEWAPAASMRDWGQHTTGPVRELTLRGGHFAAVQDPAPVLDALAADLRPAVAP